MIIEPLLAPIAFVVLVVVVLGVGLVWRLKRRRWPSFPNRSRLQSTKSLPNAQPRLPCWPNQPLPKSSGSITRLVAMCSAMRSSHSSCSLVNAAPTESLSAFQIA